MPPPFKKGKLGKVRAYHPAAELTVSFLVYSSLPGFIIWCKLFVTTSSQTKDPEEAGLQVFLHPFPGLQCFLLSAMFSAFFPSWATLESPSEINTNLE